MCMRAYSTCPASARCTWRTFASGKALAYRSIASWARPDWSPTNIGRGASDDMPQASQRGAALCLRYVENHRFGRAPAVETQPGSALGLVRPLACSAEQPLAGRRPRVPRVAGLLSGLGLGWRVRVWVLELQYGGRVAESVELCTIWLVDLVGSTRLATSVGPVRADELFEEYFTLL